MKHPDVQSRRHRVLDGALAPGEVIAAAGVVRFALPVFGLLRGRIRAATSAGDGTLAFKYVKPDIDGMFAEDGSSVHTSGNPTDLAVSTTEAVKEIDLYGEAVLLLEFTAGASGATIDSVVVTAL